MKKVCSISLIFVLVFLSAAVFAACDDTTTQDETKFYEIEFIALEGGEIVGNAKQTVAEGGSSAAIVAQANVGYYFVKWSDYETDNTDQTITTNTRTITNVNNDNVYVAYFAKQTVVVEYVTDGNGNIEGTLVQNVQYGGDGLCVTAIPNKGYRFVNWSDGLDTPTRSEQSLTENKRIIANFEIIVNTYEYEYKFADGNCNDESIALTYGQLSNTQLAVPYRDHSIFAGWYADKYLTQQVSDENGNIITNDELFYTDCAKFYAKWTTENTYTYKILVVYVTELNAEVTKKDRTGKVQVNYKMTDLERQLCHMITEKISFELNDLALAQFKVDEYFTTTEVGEESITEISPGNVETTDSKIYPYDIPEVQNMLSDYDSAIVSFSMDDYWGDLHSSAGAATGNYASVHFDGCLTQMLYYNEPIENLLNPLHWYWDQLLSTYMHELSHTIERFNGAFEFHQVTAQYVWQTAQYPLIAEKLYFLNKAVVNGETVGIPYEFWEGKVAEVYYEATEGGNVYNEKLFIHPVYGHTGDTQYVLYGDDALSVTAYPANGYKFIGWSDGILTETRQDTDINGNLHVVALFEKTD